MKFSYSRLIAVLISSAAISARSSAQDWDLADTGGNDVAAKGFVGIGTYVPLYDLDVLGDINFTGTLYFDGVAVNLSSSLLTQSGANSVFLTGNVGIGTSTPVNKLDVSGNIGSTGSGSFAGSLTAASAGFSGDVTIGNDLNVADIYSADNQTNIRNTVSKGELRLEQNGGTAGAFLRISRTISAPFFRFDFETKTDGVGLANFGADSAEFIAVNNPVNVVAIEPTYNQTEGNHALTDLLINRTETNVGSGPQRLVDAQVGGLSKFWVANTGHTFAEGSLGTGTNLYLEGTTDDAFEAQITTVDPTGSDNLHTLPDKSGTIAHLSDIPVIPSFQTPYIRTITDNTGQPVLEFDQGNASENSPYATGDWTFEGGISANYLNVADVYSADNQTNIRNTVPKGELRLEQNGGPAGAFLRISRAISAPFFRFDFETKTDGVGLANFGADSAEFIAANNPVNVVAIEPTYNQTEGNHALTDLLINRTETNVGSGPQRLVDAQVGGLSKFWVANTGHTFAEGSLGTGTNLYLEGTTDDAFEAQITTVDPTGSDNLHTLPDKSGTIAHLSDIPVIPSFQTPYIRTITDNTGQPVLEFDQGNASENSPYATGDWTFEGGISANYLNASQINASGGDQLQFQIGSTLKVAMLIDPSGDVGIGTDSPTEKLEVAGTVKVAHEFIVNGTGNSVVKGPLLLVPQGDLDMGAFTAGTDPSTL